MPTMEHGQCHPVTDCLTIWDVMSRWPHVSRYELERLINGAGGRPPLLQPYESESPLDIDTERETIYLHPMERGELTLDLEAEFMGAVRDARGRAIAAETDLVSDEFGEPMERDRLYFLLGDVLRLERDNPDYLREIPPRGRNAPPETPRRPAPQAPATVPSGRMLRAKDAAALLGIGKSTLWKWVSEGRLPAGTRLSDKATVWPEDALREFVGKRGE